VRYDPPPAIRPMTKRRPTVRRRRAPPRAAAWHPTRRSLTVLGLAVVAAMGIAAGALLLRDDPAPRTTHVLPTLKPALPEPIALPAAPPPQPSRAEAPVPRALPVPPSVAAPAAAAERPQVALAPPERPQVAALPPPVVRPHHPGGSPQWRRNAVAVAPVPAGTPRIAIVIDDLGPSQQGTAGIIALPGPLTLAFLPYATDLAPVVSRARAAGHEVIVHMPMEPTGGSVDPGPGALRVGLDADELRRRIAHGLGRFDGYVGLNNHMGSRFTADRTAMAVLMDEVARRGLLMLDSRTTAETVVEGAARSHGVPFVARDVFLDNDQRADAVGARLAETEAVARRKGQAVAIGHPHAATRAALAEWLPRVTGRGFRLVPISNLARVAAEGEARR
ncbi:MAG: divergent polysaccharide deacetylase family protein, partial [Alphaproteobacteria bacterium]